jgi:S1-C subfamily serine protease
MPESINPQVSAEQQPVREQYSFDLDTVLTSVVGVRTHVPDDALTAAVLGTERSGHGIIVEDTGLVVTIGYLVMEADSVWLLTNGGATVQGHVLGYDQESGLGLVQALGAIKQPSIGLGRTASLETGGGVIVASHGGIRHALSASVTAKREFAGYWEYLLDEALFTTPAHPSWGGAALIGEDGLLYGVGSLLVQESDSDGELADCNMFVPIDLLESSIDDLKTYGRPNRSPRPWLGVFAYDLGDDLVIAGVYNGGPAHRADLRPGDVVVDIAGYPVQGLAQLFRSIWSVGEAGVSIPMTVLRDAERLDIAVESVDRTIFGHTGNVH